ncbi:MAG: hypothetical protein U0165_11600 [Polyangiaceae bacterium]
MPAPPSVRWTLAALSLSLSTLCFSPVALADDIPRLTWGKPVSCYQTAQGEEVRVQCNPPDENGVTTCLVAPNTVKNFPGALTHVQDCENTGGADQLQALVNRGIHLVPALAEVPPGYVRDEFGRAYQVQFDLMKRFYLGAAWLPTFQLSDQAKSAGTRSPLGRAVLETGTVISVLSPRGRSRHDMHILEGRAGLDDFELRGQLFTYDYQHMHRRPAFWVTSFIGPPKRYDVVPGVGWGFRVLGINERPLAYRNVRDLEASEVHLSWNPWQSNDMYNHIRIEVGGNFGKYWDKELLPEGAWYVGPTAALRARASLGSGGLHYLTFDATFSRPTCVNSEAKKATVNRFGGQIAYEAILLAVNDQPISLRIAGGGERRRDPLTGIDSIETTASVGLRFSFWAPPRVFEPLPTFEDE